MTSDKDFVSFVKKFCSIQIRLGLLVGLGILAIVGFVFIDAVVTMGLLFRSLRSRFAVSSKM